MKTFLTLLSLALPLSFPSIAQQESRFIEKGKFNLGFNIHTISYHIYYKEGKTQGAVRSGYFTPVFVNTGYQLSDRASVRLGLGFGGDRDRLTEQMQDVEYKHDAKTFAIAGSVSFYHTFINLYKKFPIYGLVSVIPTYGFTNLHTVQREANNSTSQTIKDNGLNVFATAGVGFNYKISDSFYGNVSYFFYKTNITGPNSFYHDWDVGYPDGRSFFKSFELGLNYKL